MSKFKLGKVVMTAGIDAKIKNDEEFKKFVHQSLNRYMFCDWGEIDPHDRIESDRAVKYGNRIMGVYKHGNVTIWIITEWDRSYTTILFPHEY